MTTINHSTAHARMFVNSKNLFQAHGFNYGQLIRVAITGIVIGNPTVVTLNSPDLVDVGDNLQFFATVGPALNNLTGVVTSKTGNDVSVLVDSSTMSPYEFGGYVQIFKSPTVSTFRDGLDTHIVGMKRIAGSDMTLVIPRNNWAAGKSFSAYDSSVTQTSTQVSCFHNNHVFLCLASGSNYSTQPPAVNSYRPFTTPDGYTWLAIQEVFTSDQNRYMTTDWVPIRQSEVSNISRGEVLAVHSETNGDGYDHTTTIAITGDGSGAQARINSFDTPLGVDSSIIINNGANYNFASAHATTVVANQAVFRVILAQEILAHDVPSLLRAKNVSVVTHHTGSEGSVLPTGQLFGHGIVRSNIKSQLVDFRTTVNLSSPDHGLSVGSQVVGHLSNSVSSVLEVSGESLKFPPGTNFIEGEIIQSAGVSAIVKSLEYSSYDLKQSDIIVFSLYDLIRVENQTDEYRTILEFS